MIKLLFKAFLTDMAEAACHYTNADNDIRRDELVEEMTAAVMRFVDAVDAARKEALDVYSLPQQNSPRG